MDTESKTKITSSIASETVNQFKFLLESDLRAGLENLVAFLQAYSGKKSFLVFKHNKYIIVPTESIALFYVKNNCLTITCFDQNEYHANYSLDQIQHVLTCRQFFRLNRQYLINFSAVKEVEHYFSRKLLVRLIIPFPENLLVSKEKVGYFLSWLENR